MAELAFAEKAWDLATCKCNAAAPFWSFAFAVVATNPFAVMRRAGHSGDAVLRPWAGQSPSPSRAPRQHAAPARRRLAITIRVERDDLPRATTASSLHRCRPMVARVDQARRRHHQVTPPNAEAHLDDAALIGKLGVNPSVAQ
jgi:hypothetical protein